MKDAYYEAFVQIRLILDGAIRLFENDTTEILVRLKDQEKDGLFTALDSIGEALYWARGKAHDALLHGLCASHAPDTD